MVRFPQNATHFHTLFIFTSNDINYQSFNLPTTSFIDSHLSHSIAAYLLDCISMWLYKYYVMMIKYIRMSNIFMNLFIFVKSLSFHCDILTFYRNIPVCRLENYCKPLNEILSSTLWDVKYLDQCNICIEHVSKSACDREVFESY